MRKIDKSKILSVEYKEWLESLDGQNHPKYNSSNGKFYRDIKMSLLHCQGSLCAYTEKLLCDPKYISRDSWNDEKYIKKLTKFDNDSIKGDLEHFDESLKLKQAWHWDNLFIVDTHINCRVKAIKPIKYILKPDSINYDPYKYLEFDFDTGVFFAKTTLSEEEKIDVKYMIITLGLNCYAYERKKQLKDYKDMMEVGLKVVPKEYITSWNMTLDKLVDK